MKNFTKILETFFALEYGIFCLHLWFSGKVTWYIHPDYALYVLASGLILLALGLFFLGEFFLLKQAAKQTSAHPFQSVSLGQWILIAIPMVVSLIVPQQPLSSASAVNRMGNLYEDSALSRSEKTISTFLFNTETRPLIDWVRLFAQNPDATFANGLKADLTGFTVPLGTSNATTSPDGSTQAKQPFLLAQYVLSCCAADARPVGVVVAPNIACSPQSSASQNQTWLRVRGHFEIQTVQGQSQPVLIPDSCEEVSAPADPYAYQ